MSLKLSYDEEWEVSRYRGGLNRKRRRWRWTEELQELTRRTRHVNRYLGALNCQNPTTIGG